MLRALPVASQRSSRRRSCSHVLSWSSLLAKLRALLIDRDG